MAEVMIEDETTVIPDITQITLDSFGTLPGTEDSAADLLVLGDLSGMFDLRDMTLGSAVSHWPRPQLQQLTLDQYAFLADMTIAEVADMSGLYSESVDDIPIVEKAISTFLKNPVLASERNLTLSQFLDRYPEIGSIKLGFQFLDRYPEIGSIKLGYYSSRSITTLRFPSYCLRPLQQSLGGKN